MALAKTIKKWWHQLSSPHYFEKIAQRCEPWCWSLTLILLIIGIFWGLFIAPADRLQKDAFRIIYIHVPAAVMSMGIYVSMAIAACIYFVWHIKLAAYYCRVMAILGAAFTFLALVTGAVWGKPMWGTYWTWDARLTSELILLFIYLGYISLVSASTNQDYADKIGSILLAVGVINIPIIHYSVIWWNSLHQSATILKMGKPSISTEMLWPLLVCLSAFMLFSIAYSFTALRAKIIEQKNNQIILERLNS